MNCNICHETIFNQNDSLVCNGCGIDVCPSHIHFYNWESPLDGYCDDCWKKRNEKLQEIKGLDMQMLAIKVLEIEDRLDRIDEKIETIDHGYIDDLNADMKRVKAAVQNLEHELS